MLYAKLVLMAVFWSGVFPAVNIVLKSMGLFTSTFVRFWAAAVMGLGVLGIAAYNAVFMAGSRWWRRAARR